MTNLQHQDVACVLLDALTALDPTDPSASEKAVPLALSRLAEVVGEDHAGDTSVALGAIALAHVCVALVANVKQVDRLDVIAALRPMFSAAAGPQAA